MAYTTIDDPSAHFQVKTYTGTSNIHDVTLDGNSDMQPDLVWFKNRDVGYVHHLYDSSRGVKKALYSNGTNAEATITNGLTQFHTDGFRVTSAAAINEDSIVCWNWKANGGTTSSNTNGDINSTVQVNQDAGFSIVTYTGNGSTSDQTIGHGLGVRANAVIIKNRDSAVNWVVWVEGVDANHSLELNTADGISDSTQGRVLSNAGSRGTSTIFSIRSGSGSVVQTNTNNEDYVAYCFAEKQGYSRFGSYIGNGINNDGPSVYLGFKPAFVMIKSTAATGAHYMWDTKRSPYNGMDDYINAAESDAEGTNGILTIDVLSNGFKVMNTGTNNGTNQSGTKYVYYAWAENPFVTSTGVPATAY